MVFLYRGSTILLYSDRVIVITSPIKAYKVEFRGKIYFDRLDIRGFNQLIDINNIFETPTQSTLKLGITSIVKIYKSVYPKGNSYKRKRIKA